MAYTLVPTELIQDGAVTSAKLDTNIAISGTLSVAGVTTLATHLVMGDNDKIKIGTGGDLEIYHDASNSYIANSTGNLYIGDTNGSVHIQAKLNEDSIVAAADGAVTLYYDNAAKLATSSAGVTVTGTVNSGNIIITDAGPQIDFIDSDNNPDFRIKNGNGSLRFTDTTNIADRLSISGIGDISFYNTAGSSQALFWDASAESLCLGNTSAGAKLDIRQDSGYAIRVENNLGSYFRVAAGGATEIGGNLDVTGTATMDGLTVSGSSTGTLNVVNFLNTDTSANQTANRLGLGISNSAGTNYTYIEAKEIGVDAYAEMNFYTGSTTRKRLTLGTGGNISFYEDTGSTAKFFWDASAERLGIGTTSPRSLLNVTGTNADGGILTLENNSNSLQTNRAVGQLDFYSNDGSANGTGVKAKIQAIALNSIGNEVGLTFGTSGTGSSTAVEAMRIDSSGNVHAGGSTSITATVSGDNNAPTFIVEDSLATSIALLRSDTSIVSGNSFGSYAWYGTDTTSNLPRPLAAIQAIASGTHSAGDNPTDIRFLVTPDGTESLSEKMRIDSSGSVGIGTTNPSDELTIRGAQFNTTQVSIGDNSDRLRLGYIHSSSLESSTTAGQLVTTAGTELKIAAPSNSASNIQLYTNLTSGAPLERARIDSSGNLLVGKTATTLSVTGTYISATGSVGVTRASDDCLTLNRTGNDGAIASFYKNGTTVGSIGNQSTRPYFASTDCGIRLGGSDLLPATSTGIVSDNVVSLGSSSGRFKDLYLSGGVHLGGSGSANHLDDYEEGTFTPSIGSGSGSFGGVAYTKVGRLVTCHFVLSNITDTTTGNNFLVGNLPFAAESADRPLTIGSLAQNISSSFGTITGGYLDTTTSIRLYTTSSGAYRALKHSDINASAGMYVAFSYMAS